MDTSKDYYESVIRNFLTYGRGRSLEQFCRDEAGPDAAKPQWRVASLKVTTPLGHEIEITTSNMRGCARHLPRGLQRHASRLQGHHAKGKAGADRHRDPPYALMYSLVESCRMNGLDFGLYIETVLRRILDGDTDIHGMLPNVITLPNEAQNTSAA